MANRDQSYAVHAANGDLVTACGRHLKGAINTHDKPEPDCLACRRRLGLVT